MQYRVDAHHMVGDGFRVCNYIPGPPQIRQEISPFLMLDYNPPHAFPVSETPRGVDVHPHKGFETVTVVFEGELAHADSTGSSGVIGVDEVQWMTAGAGILHKEFQTPEFSRSGGVQHMLQLWVNLPAKHKGHPPRYQSLTRDNIPVKTEGESLIRVLAGDYEGLRGPAETFSPLTLLDIRLAPGRAFGMAIPEVWNAALLVVDGEMRYAGKTPAPRGEFLLLDHQGAQVLFDAGDEGTRVILMAGEPLNEPIAAYGPFVMNTQREIMDAIESFQRGDFGRMA
jgi:quercetin 2,3-dioxygenase